MNAIDSGEFDVFRYPMSRIVIQHLLMIMSMLVNLGLLSFVVWYILTYPGGETAGSVGACLILVAAAYGYGLLEWKHIQRSRPLKIGLNEIQSLGLGGTPRRTIAWDQVQRIVKRRYYSSLYSRYEATFAIYDKVGQIKFDSSIMNLSKALSLVNAQIARNRIPTVLSDTGLDTLRQGNTKIGATPTSFSFLRSGVETTITELTWTDAGR